MIMRDEHLPNAEATDGEWGTDGEGVGFTRALADRVRQSLAQEQVLQTITERLEAGASEAVHHVLHTRLSPAIYDVLHTDQRESAVVSATSHLDDRLVEVVEQEVIAALRDRVTGVLRERLDPALGTAIARSGDDVTLDAGAELALQLRRAVELGIRDRLRDGLRYPDGSSSPR